MPWAARPRNFSRIAIGEMSHDLEKQKAKEARTSKAFLRCIKFATRYTSFMTHNPGPVKPADDAAGRLCSPRSMKEGP